MPRHPTVRTVLAVAATLAWTSGIVRSQDPASLDEPANRIKNAWFAVDLPPGWRELTPVDMRDLARELPFELRGIQQGSLSVYGPVDSWLSQGFGRSRAFVVVRKQGEIAMDRAGLDTVTRYLEGRIDGAVRRREVLDASIGTIGMDDHPALWVTSRTLDADSEADDPAFNSEVGNSGMGNSGVGNSATDQSGPGSGPATAVEAYVPTAGQMLILGEWSWEDPGTRVPPDSSPPDWARTVSIARLPRGPADRGDQLLMALALGVVLTGLLLVLRKHRAARRAPTGTT